MIFIDQKKINLPLELSSNFFYNNKKGSVILLNLNKLEHYGKIVTLDKNLNFVLNKCFRSVEYDLTLNLSKFEIVFIRGENIISFLLIPNEN